MKLFTRTKQSLAALIALIVVTTGLHAPVTRADDTEIFVSSGNTANVLFVFDLSGSMGSSPDSSTSKSKYQILQESLTTVLNNLKTKSNLQIGLSLYGVNSQTTGIRWPVRSISEDATLTDSAITAGTYQTYSIILKQLADYGVDGGTPIVTALYEAALYYMGSPVSYGNGGRKPPLWNGSTYAGGDENAAHPASYTPATAWNAGTSSFDASAKYISPITNSCEKSYVVLMSDGQANSPNTTIQNRIATLIGKSCNTSVSDGEKCGTELVEYLANTDLQAANGIVPSKVITHTIGFSVKGSGQTFLQNLAASGGGNFYPADNATQLEQSLDTILTSIASENQSFTGLTTSINASTLSSDNRVFINMFKPDASRSWRGNTKGYFIGLNGLTDINNNPAIEVVNGDVQFKATAQSFWSASADGNNVDQGGASGKFNPATRNIYTYTGSAPVPLNSALTKITTSAGSITNTMFDVATTTEKNDLINWLYNAPMGDPMHANTVMISYTPTLKVLYTMTNQGLLHAINVTNPTATGDSSGGNELSAFIPQSLLSRIKDHKADIAGTNHLYGLDGTMTHWHDDADKNGQVNGTEKVYLYFGMRRGGNQYFALDVTNPSTPKLAWRIDGGSAGFTGLGQTWSRPVVTTVNWSGAGANPDKKVIFFGGGYDVAEDGYIDRTDDSIGNAVYMVDATTGTLLWSAQKSGTAAGNLTVLSDLKYSIPADLKIIDTDNDKHADRLYFGDLGGQVWRIDLLSNFGAASGVSAYRLAELAKGGDQDFRRFYMPPSVALIRDRGTMYYAVAIGSGARVNPLGTGVDDRFHLIKDTNLTAGLAWSTVKEGDLYNATANLIGQGTAAQQSSEQAKLDGKKGWYIDLMNSGEKAISPSLIFNNMLAFTTYSPTSSGLSCNTTAGTGRLYLVSLTNATPIYDQVPDNNLIAEDRSTIAPGIGIPTAPIPYFPPGKGQVDLYIGNEKVVQIDNPMARIHWKVIE